MKAPKMVRYSFDLDNPPPLTPEQKAELEALALRSDDDIDFSDIPPLTEDFWRNAKRGPFYRPVKQQLTLRLDAPVVEWFKRQATGGKGYQTDINRVLSEYVAAKRRKAAKKAG